MEPQPRTFGKVRIAYTPQEEALSRLASSAWQRTPLCATYLNAHNINVAHNDLRYYAALGDFQLIIPEGKGISLAAQLLGYREFKMYHSTDLWFELLNELKGEGLRIFFVGSTDTTLDTATDRMQDEFGFKVCGRANGYSDLDDTKTLRARIRAASPDILLIGMGVPKQELWTVLHGASTGVPVILCVGNFLEFFAGHRARAPRWMTSIGLEWLHRLLSEPRRLWKRYILGIPLFFWRVLRVQ
ncbi:MAG: hypothetical protein CL946_02275 [Ectothiorhodospiraceae bacterium]|nr:hypothetical protein [Ectothiorhodospiraceae bacterium]